MHSHNLRIESFKKNYNLSEEEAKSAIELLDNFLPHGYSEQIIVLALRNKENITANSVRLIKAGNYKNARVFKYLIEFAAEKKAIELAAHVDIKKTISA